MGEVAVVKEKRVTRRESTTFACVFTNSIVLELGPTQLFSLYIDLAKCNLHERT